MADWPAALSRLRTFDVCHAPPLCDLIPRRFNSAAIAAVRHALCPDRLEDWAELCREVCRIRCGGLLWAHSAHASGLEPSSPVPTRVPVRLPGPPWFAVRWLPAAPELRAPECRWSAHSLRACRRQERESILFAHGYRLVFIGRPKTGHGVTPHIAKYLRGLSTQLIYVGPTQRQQLRYLML